MTVKIIEELYCDRCETVFEKRGPTMEIGWFKLYNGGGSKPSTVGRKENLDYDLCNACTEAFEEWWDTPPR